MSVSPQPEPGGDSDRIRCLYCGANNFPASLACWQCSRPLKAGHAAPAQVSGLPPVQPFAAAVAARPAPAESPLAPKAAAVLGMLFPYIGLPTGMVFLMLDDPRKTQLGWLLIGWSLGGTVLSVLSLAATLGPLWVLLRGMLPHPGGPPSLPSFGGEGVFLQVWSLIYPFQRI